jgi:hypothetical protein
MVSLSFAIGLGVAKLRELVTAPTPKLSPPED